MGLPTTIISVLVFLLCVSVAIIIMVAPNIYSPKLKENMGNTTDVLGTENTDRKKALDALQITTGTMGWAVVGMVSAAALLAVGLGVYDIFAKKSFLN